MKLLKRGSGRPPNDSDNLITALLIEKTDEDSRKFVHAVFRAFVAKLLANQVALMQLFLTAEDLSRYKAIVMMAENVQTIYLESGINDNAKSNLLSRLCYKFTKYDEEEFFKHDILSSLFNELIPEIMDDDYIECPGRRDNRTEAIMRRANQDSSEVPS